MAVQPDISLQWFEQCDVSLLWKIECNGLYSAIYHCYDTMNAMVCTARYITVIELYKSQQIEYLETK